MGLITVLDIQYFPPIPYFAAILDSHNLLFENGEHFVKQTYRNRCRILTANGTEDLVIPLRRPRQHIRITEIQIDYTQNWPLQHWKAIQSAYGKSPWFNHFQDEIHDTLLSEKQNLVDFNLSIIDLCFNLLGINKKYGFTGQYFKNLPENYLDLRSVIHPKKENGNLSFYRPVKYMQNFGDRFIDSLSVIDLIFSEGPHAPALISGTLNPSLS